jgi:hypothetical protein
MFRIMYPLCLHKNYYRKKLTHNVMATNQIFDLEV